MPKIFLNKKGFTLLETIVAMSILTMILFSAIVMFRFSFTSRAIIAEQLLTQTEGRRIVQEFVNEIRSATLSSNGAYPVASASSTEFIFYTNRDSDNYKEKVRYFLSGTDFKRGITKPTEPSMVYSSSNESIAILAEDVVNGSTPVFIYYGEDYDGVSSTVALSLPSDITEIRAVKIHLELEADPNMAPEPFTVEAIGQIRNLKEN